MYPRPNITSSLSIVELASSTLAIYCTYAALNLSEIIWSKTWTFVHSDKYRERDLIFSQLLQSVASEDSYDCIVITERNGEVVQRLSYRGHFVIRYK